MGREAGAAEPGSSMGQTCPHQASLVSKVFAKFERVIQVPGPCVAPPAMAPDATAAAQEAVHVHCTPRRQMCITQGLQICNTEMLHMRMAADQPPLETAATVIEGCKSAPELPQMCMAADQLHLE